MLVSSRFDTAICSIHQPRNPLFYDLFLLLRNLMGSSTNSALLPRWQLWANCLRMMIKTSFYGFSASAQSNTVALEGSCQSMIYRSVLESTSTCTEQWGQVLAQGISTRAFDWAWQASTYYKPDVRTISYLYHMVAFFFSIVHSEPIPRWLPTNETLFHPCT